jgi:hypothetical protein
MGFGDVVDEFHDGHGLAHAGAAKQADLAALEVGARRSITLMPVTSFPFRSTARQSRGRAVDRQVLFGAQPGRVRQPARRSRPGCGQAFQGRPALDGVARVLTS